MYARMQSAQQSYSLSERLIRSITYCNTLEHCDEDVQDLINEVEGLHQVFTPCSVFTPRNSIADIQHLINQGADVNRMHGTVLPLHCACMVSDVDIVTLLLENGAQVDLLDGYGRAAIHYAAEKRDETSVDCVRILIANGADVNQRDHNNDTALHWAAYRDIPQCVHALLQNGAKVDAMDDSHHTPLSWASHRGNIQCIRILLDYNADPGLSSNQGNTPVLRSAQIQAAGLGNQNDVDTLDLLLRASGKFITHNDDQRGGNNVQLLPNTIQQDNKMRELLLPYLNTPRRLQDLCRYQIRRRLGSRYLPSLVPGLPLPNRLHHFLLLRT